MRTCNSADECGANEECDTFENRCVRTLAEEDLVDHTGAYNKVISQPATTTAAPADNGNNGQPTFSSSEETSSAALVKVLSGAVAGVAAAAAAMAFQLF